MQEIKATYWLFIVREGGLLELYSLPDFKLSYVVKNFGHGLRVLSDSLEATPSLAGPPDSSKEPLLSSMESEVAKTVINPTVIRTHLFVF